MGGSVVPTLRHMADHQHGGHVREGGLPVHKAAAREIKDVTAKMQDAAAKLDFEQAVKYRDRLTQLKDLLIKSK